MCVFVFVFCVCVCFSAALVRSELRSRKHADGRDSSEVMKGLTMQASAGHFPCTVVKGIDQCSVGSLVLSMIYSIGGTVWFSHIMPSTTLPPPEW